MDDQQADENTEAVTPSNFRYVGSPTSAPTIFADTAAFATRVGGSIRVQLIESVPGASDSVEPGMNARYIANIVFPIEGFANFLSYLNGVAPTFDLPETP